MNKWIVIVYQWVEKTNTACSCHPEYEYSGNEAMEIASFQSDEAAATFIADKSFNYPHKYIRVIDQMGDTEGYEWLEPDCGSYSCALFDHYNAEDDENRRTAFKTLDDLANVKYTVFVEAKKEKQRLEKEAEERKKAEQAKAEQEKKEQQEKATYERLKAKFGG